MFLLIEHAKLRPILIAVRLAKQRIKGGLLLDPNTALILGNVDRQLADVRCSAGDFGFLAYGFKGDEYTSEDGVFSTGRNAGMVHVERRE